MHLGSEDEKDAERWRGMRSNEEQTRRKRESEVTIQIFGTKADRDWEESFENNISVEVASSVPHVSSFTRSTLGGLRLYALSQRSRLIRNALMTVCPAHNILSDEPT